MRQIIYASSCEHEMTPEGLDLIAIQAHRNNPKDDITGILLYGDHLFFQVLEGPDEQMTQMMEKIWSDPRHQGITEFKNAPVTGRCFPDWSMGCYHPDATGDRAGSWRITDIESITARMPETITPDVMVLIRTFFQSITRK